MLSISKGQLRVWLVCYSDADHQRDAISNGRDVTYAAFFARDPWDWVRCALPLKGLHRGIVNHCTLQG